MLYFRSGLKKWSCGRVARQSSAKAPTPVRIWSGPRKIKSSVKVAFFIVQCKPCSILEYRKFSKSL